ncbi:MAG: hypothetical protein Q8R18_05765 [bacterium]|nr:hypothetical protein [bacterium]
MNNKHLGVILIIIAILMGIFLFVTKQQEDLYLDKIIEEQDGVCYVDGVCVHDQQFIKYLIGGFLALAVALSGLYLFFFDKSQRRLLQQHKEVAYALKEVKEKDEFQAYLAGFSEEEQKVLKAVHEQEGIQQSTLRYRTGIAKTSLSLLLKSLEERGIISKKEHGKTNQIFLVRKF